jgi:hypothetical protein
MTEVELASSFGGLSQAINTEGELYKSLKFHNIFFNAIRNKHIFTKSQADSNKGSS